MNKLYLLAAALILAASIALFNQSPYAPIYSFEQYKADFSKQYQNKGGEEYRRIIYLQNLARITQHNSDPYRTYNKGVNKFTDHTQFELETIYLTSIPSSASILSNPLTTPLNVNVDWAAAGKVTPVINQGQCGSSWAFPATNALESVKLIQEGSTEIFSVQDLLDCSWEYGNNGCNGGLMDNAFKYIRDKGIATNETYPYQARNLDCKASVPRAQKISGYVDVPGCDNMLNALAGRPIATAADASTWFDYESGILTNCKNNPNHGIFLVGATNDYWKLKNSWGGDWGEKGYIRIGRGNSCGICNQGSYPIL